MKKNDQSKKLLVILSFILLTSWLAASCGMHNQPSPTTIPPETPAESSFLPENGGTDPENTADPMDKRLQEMIDNMSLEEKVGQMLFVAYRKNSAGEKVLEMDDTLKEILSKYKPGGFALFADNLESIEQTVNLIESLQAGSKIPMFVSLDEEGGIVSRLNKAAKLHSTVMPDPYTIGLTERPEYAYAAAHAIASEVLSLRFNMDFAPVADIFSNPENKVIGKRAYGTEPELVSRMVGEAVTGFIDGQVIPVLKHFPGHGDTLEDTHTGAALVKHDLNRLASFELLPFQEGIAAGAGAVMIAHILLPSLMEDPVPATLSKEVVTGILREKLKFDGVIITDAMEMSAVSAYYDDDEAAVMAVLAGVDMILMPQSIEKAYNAILSAVKEGLIPEERINESVYRILRLKEKYGILENRIVRPDPEQTLGCAEHQALADAIREAAEKQ